MKHILFSMLVAIAVVDSIEGDFASVEVLNRGRYEYIDVKLKDIPCTIREGDEIVFTEDEKGKRKIRCILNKRKKCTSK